jgi:hypothetical protein
MFRPLPRLEREGGAGPRGFLAALMLPSGVEEKVMFAVAAEVETEWGAPRGRCSGERCEWEALASGLEGKGGDDGEGEPRGESSYSASGVDAAESMAAVVVSVVEGSVCGLISGAGVEVVMGLAVVIIRSRVDVSRCCGSTEKLRRGDLAEVRDSGVCRRG